MYYMLNPNMLKRWHKTMLVGVTFKQICPRECQSTPLNDRITNARKIPFNAHQQLLLGRPKQNQIKRETRRKRKRKKKRVAEAKDGRREIWLVVLLNYYSNITQLTCNVPSYAFLTGG
ncbi:hypothetical protein HELRODRAFT_180300 [Helobdella robusta]|uniref:Uncharacterized protein n=1 Tax=Helobdella robusta TaxID=6412 RepID=T1FFP9_HELRO|nr:hypothetical protein HELRODRAFT_180300 [Helobdella robusta]ESN94130.1 hypothetical protein HELRODRAFT_180300 [Helobdella robusta]